MVQVTKSLALAAMVIAPVLSAPVLLQAAEADYFERGFSDGPASDVFYSRQGKSADRGRHRWLPGAIGAFSALSAGVSLSTGLNALFKKNPPPPPVNVRRSELHDGELELVLRDILENVDIEARIRRCGNDSRGGIRPAIRLRIAPTMIPRGRPELRALGGDDISVYGARDYYCQDAMLERSYYDDAMYYERDLFVDGLD